MTNFIVFFILAISTITDIRERKILNIVTLSPILVAVIYYSINAGVSGFLFSGQGFFVGLGLLLIPFIMGGIGAGDVKLLAAVGAWKGTMFVLYTGIYAGIFGGLIALFIIFKQKQLGFTFKKMLFSLFFLKSSKGSLELSASNQHQVSIPYAVPITLGAIMTFIMERF